MRIFEKFITEPDETKQDVIDYLYGVRATPCVINDEFNYITDKAIQKLCDNNTNDCEKCLEKYLDIEIENKKKEIILENQVKMEV